MAQLNKFIQALHDRRADALSLVGGEPISITIAGKTVPITRDRLSPPALLKLLGEITPPDLAEDLAERKQFGFVYGAPSGPVNVAVEPTGSSIRVSLSPKPVAAATPAKAAPARPDAEPSDATAQAEPVEPEPNAPAPTANAEPPAQEQEAPAESKQEAPPPEAAPPKAVSTPEPAPPPATPKPDEAVTPISSARPVTNRGDLGAQAELDRLLAELVHAGGSDLHLRVGEPALFRHDGRLARLDEPPYDSDWVQAMLDAIMPEKDRKRHAEKGDADFAYEIADLARFRVNAARDREGPMAVFRVIPSLIPTCDDLDITPEVRNLCQLTKGLVVVTGPTGCGKSTTLAALVNLMNANREDHILTIEDPIEFVHKSQKCLVTHRQVGVHTESFKTGLRAALREDPDIVLIGELRDLETVAIAIETAETGHLVFGTLHTTTAVSTIDRIIDQFQADRQAQIRVMLSESLRGVVAQTLCRKVGGGRVAAREILLSSPAVSNLIREGKTFQLPSIIQTNRKIGMITMNESLLDLVDRKLIAPQEAYMKAVDKMGIRNALSTRGIDCSFLAA